MRTFLCCLLVVSTAWALPLPEEEDASRGGNKAPPKGNPVEWVEYGMQGQTFSNPFGTSGAQTYLMKNPQDTPFGPQPGYDMKLEEDNPALEMMKVLHRQMMSMPFEEKWVNAEREASRAAKETNLKNFEENRTLVMTEKLQRDAEADEVPR